MGATDRGTILRHLLVITSVLSCPPTHAPCWKSATTLRDEALKTKGGFVDHSIFQMVPTGLVL